MADTRHLKLRGRTWFVRVRTPKDLRDSFGYEVVRTTGTQSLREAQDRRHGIIAAIKAEFRKQAGGGNTPEGREELIAAARERLLVDLRAKLTRDLH